MSEQKRKRALYDAEESRNKIRAALEKLVKTEKPGALTRKAGKAEILRSMRDELVAVLEKKYLPAQIAEAIRNGDVFDILPKSITQAVSQSAKVDNVPQKTKSAQRAKKVSPTTTGKTVTKRDPKKETTKSITKSEKTEQTRSGGFDVTPDTPDDEL